MASRQILDAALKPLRQPFCSASARADFNVRAYLRLIFTILKSPRGTLDCRRPIVPDYLLAVRPVRKRGTSVPARV